MDFNNISIQDLQLGHSIEVNPSTGSVSASIRIPTPEGRKGFSPVLSLQYNSSSQNSLFGLGWNLSGLSSISIDTSKGLPKYDGSDQFSFNGSVLVPHYSKKDNAWQPRVDENDKYWIYYFRTTKEESFIRIEKWVHKLTGKIHWRTRSKTDVLSVFGSDDSGINRITDPENENKIFAWLLESQYDNLGNAIHYIYKSENSDNIDPLISFETNRLKKFSQKGFAQKIIERVVYGNTIPIVTNEPVPANNQWLFEIVFDYGEFNDRPYTNCIPSLDEKRLKRPDPYSVYSTGFELRTYRLCRRILTYHHFNELSTPTSLTGIFECIYNENESGTTLQGVSYTGVRRDLITGAYSEKQLPELIFNYTCPEIGKVFNAIVQETNQNLPYGFNHSGTQYIDLLGEGIPGILTESNNAWYYKPNLGNGVFGKQELIINKPSDAIGIYALGDFDGDGNLNLFSLQGRMAGYYEYDRDLEKWNGFKTFENIPQVGHSKFMDVDADGFPDLVVECEDKVICYPFKGKEGFGKPYEFSKSISNGVDYAPIIGDNLSLDYFLADMTGDGLPDQVRIKNGRVAYYPNLGNGRFGEVVIMENSPIIDFDTTFDASRIRLFDLDGSGTSDIIYIGNGELRYWYNASGNKFVEGGRITNLPYIDNISSAIILDFLCTGTPCLVWSNSLSYLQYSAVQYLELTSGIKPRLLTSLENSMGMEVQIEYGHSAKHYLEAKKEGNPWISKIPGHFTVVDKKIVVDHITKSTVTTQYKYRDGHYDGNERSFVTFGLVDQYDTQIFENDSITHEKGYAEPSCTRTWIHNGMWGWDIKMVQQYYAHDLQQPLLIPQTFEKNDSLDVEDFESGYRSLAGHVIRQEIYAADQHGFLKMHPYQVVQNAYCIRMIQPQLKAKDACFFVYQTESLTSNYEQQANDPQISHQIAIDVNDFGDTEKALSICYARRSSVEDILESQDKDYITCSVQKFVHENHQSKYHTSILYEAQAYEINHIIHPKDKILKWEEARLALDNIEQNIISFDQQLSSNGPTLARLVGISKNYFWNDDFSNVLPLTQVGKLTFPHHSESACFNDSLIEQIYQGKVTHDMLSSANEGNYIQREGYWWCQSPIHHYKDANGFYNVDFVEREAGNITRNIYDPYQLNIVEIIQPIGNSAKGEIDYNTLAIYRMTDQNDNVSEVLYDPLGITIASFHLGTVLDQNNVLRNYGNGKLENYSRRNNESFENILAEPQFYLQEADHFLFYDLNYSKELNQPLQSISIVRGNLIHDGLGNIDHAIKYQLELNYQDGFGRIIQAKKKVEPGLAVVRNAEGNIVLDAMGVPLQTNTDERWLVSGHMVYNNKQQVIRQFEPFFSSLSTYEKDELLENYGVSTQNYYDAIGKLYRTDFPNSTFTEGIFTPWEVISFDQNDTVDRSFYKTFREFLPDEAPEKMALNRSLAHKDTPAIVKLDPMGREILNIETNNNGTVRKSEVRYDGMGNVVEVIDSRNLKAFQYKYDMLGRLLYEKSMDAGQKWSFLNCMNEAIHFWDGRQVHQRTFFDQIGRVTSIQVDGALGLNQITERFIYGEDSTIDRAKERNMLGQLVKHYDQAGTQENKLFSPEGLSLISERRLLDQLITEANWNDMDLSQLSDEVFQSKFIYDALGRPMQQELCDHTIRQYIFNQGGGIQKVLVSTTDGKLSEVEMLKNASYDAKGLRQTSLLGNGVEIDYQYDSETFRMTRLRSRKIAGAPRLYQDILYTYDPMGNLIHFIDQAQQQATTNAHIIEGLNISAHSDFEYDALYQLKSAKGRVHQALVQHDYVDRSNETNVPSNWAKGTRHISLNNGASVERYTRTYEYDTSGNIISMKHVGASQRWTQEIWTSPNSNRSLPLHDLNDTPITTPENYFDENGNCIRHPHLRKIAWNYRNNISKVVIIDRTDQGKPNDEEYYVYAGDGMRVRKITQKLVNSTDNIIELTEKTYLNGCEIKRITRGGKEILKRFTSQINDGTNSIALIHSWELDTFSTETDDISQCKIHYQLSNHMGSASLELDEQGDLITYEEYFPYGGTSFQAGRNKRDINLKDYRYSGKERDDFTGLYYFGYRYYAHWLGGWMSPDPIGPQDGLNLYLYVQNNPINLIDPNGLQSTNKKNTVRPSQENNTEEDVKKYWTGRIIPYEGRTVLIEEVYNVVPSADTDIKWEWNFKSIDIDCSDYQAQKDEEAFIDETTVVADRPDDTDAVSQTPTTQSAGAAGEAADSKGKSKNDLAYNYCTDLSAKKAGGGPKTKKAKPTSKSSSKTVTKPGTKGTTGTTGTQVPKVAGAGINPDKNADPKNQGTVVGGNGDGKVEDIKGTPPIGDEVSNGVPDGVVPGMIEENGTGGQPKNRNGNGGKGNGNGTAPPGSGGYKPKGSNSEMPWWLTPFDALVKMAAGVAYNIYNMIAEPIKQLYDVVGLTTWWIGHETGWWEYYHDEMASGVGQAAAQGKGSLDILSDMGKGIVGTPGRLWSAAENGDWFNVGNEGTNFVMMVKGGYSLGKSAGGFALNRGINGMGDLGTYLKSSKPSGSTLFELGEIFEGAKTLIRNKQVISLGKKATSTGFLKDKIPEIKWQYAGKGPPNVYAEFNGASAINVFETTFTPPIFGPRLGLVSPLRGQHIMNPILHEGYHAYQLKYHESFFDSPLNCKTNVAYNLRPTEFSQFNSQYPMGAHNFAAQMAPASNFMTFFGFFGVTINNANNNQQ